MMSRENKLAVKVLLGVLAGVLFCCGSGLWGLWPKVKLDGPMLSWEDVPGSRGTLDQLPLENGWIRFVMGDHSDSFFFSGQASEADIMKWVQGLPENISAGPLHASLEAWAGESNFPGLSPDDLHQLDYDDVYYVRGRLKAHLWMELRYSPRTRRYAGMLHTLGQLNTLDTPDDYVRWRRVKLREWKDAGRR